MTKRPNTALQVGPYSCGIEDGRLVVQPARPTLWQRAPDCLGIVTETGEHYTALTTCAPAGNATPTAARLTDWLLQRQRTKINWSIWACPALAAALVAARWPWLAPLALVPAGVWSLRRRQRAALLFALGPAAQARFHIMERQLQQLGQARNVWHIDGAKTVKIPGLYTLTYVNKVKAPLKCAAGLPATLGCNLVIPTMTAGETTWYFMPHALVIVGAGTVREIAYQRINVRTTRINLREEGDIPPGGAITGRTWRHIGKDGKRLDTMGENPSFPVVGYVQTTLFTQDGFMANFLSLRSSSMAPLLAAIAGNTSGAYEGADGYSGPRGAVQKEQTGSAVPAKTMPRERLVPDRPPYVEELNRPTSDAVAPATSAPAKQPRRGAAHSRPIFFAPTEPSTRGGEIPIPQRPSGAVAPTSGDTIGANSLHDDGGSDRFQVDPAGGEINNQHGRRSTPSGAAPLALPANCRWIRKGESLSAGGLDIPGGLLYVRSAGHSDDEVMDPSVIDITAPVHMQDVELVDAKMGYWPNYSQITPRARRGYLQWLAGGRCEPNVDIGYVFLFFYGLERRVLADRTADLDEFELADIAQETQTLLVIYGGNGSFRHYAEGLLEYIAALGVQGKTYLAAPPKLRRGSNSTPLQIKLALAQLAAESLPLPAQWALAWAATAPTIRFGRHVERCKREFAELFRIRYAEAYPDGMMLKAGRVALKLSYRAASAALQDTMFSPDLQNLPDVAQAPKYIAQLQELADVCARDLAPFSKCVLKANSPESLSKAAYLLPFAIWPEDLRRPVQALWEAIGEGPLAIEQDRLVSHFLHEMPPSKTDLTMIARAAEAAGIGIEPGLVSKQATSGTTIHFLYRAAAGNDDLVGENDWRRCVLALTASVGNRKGEGVPPPITLAMDGFADWEGGLSLGVKRQLRACAAALRERPPSVNSITKKLSALPKVQAADCLGFAAAMLLARDNEAYQTKLLHCMASIAMTGPEAKALLHDRRYALPEPVSPLPAQATLQSAVISDGERAARPEWLPRDGSAPVTVHRTEVQDTVAPLQLDAQRIADIVRDTARVNSILTAVFQSDEPVADGTPSPNMLSNDRPEKRRATIWGLSPRLSALLKHLLRRPTWQRQELERQCARLGLMLDGAIEALNDAAYDHADAALTDGTDPICIDLTLADKVPA